MTDAQASAPIDLLCDAHLRRQGRGPLITLVGGRWAYCAGNATDGHQWRRVAPIERDLFEAMPDRVGLICDGERHLQQGRSIPNGYGKLTFADGKWAYCSASLNEPHHWVTVEPMEFDAIDHAALAERFEGRP